MNFLGVETVCDHRIQFASLDFVWQRTFVSIIMYRFSSTLRTSSSGKAALRSLRRYKSAPAVEHSSTTSSAQSAHAAATSSSSSSSSSTLVAQSLLAAVLGIGTVSLAAAAVENASASSVPKFDLKGQRFDESNFMGRFSRMLLACDPRLLLYSTEQVQHSKHLIENYQDYSQKQGNGSAFVSDRALWEARRIVEAALHPDTGDVIPRPFRMSGYVPYNGPICVAMVASQSTPALLFWSWINQSQNALVNYYNRNASSPMSNETLLTSYAAAVGSALLVAFGLATAIQRRFEPAKAKALLRWVAFPSAVVASSLNCYIVRSPEMATGIPLLDADGYDVLPGETSQIAATRGVHSTTLSRAILQAPVYFLPPVLLSAVPPIRHLLARHPGLTVPVTTYLLLVSFGIGLPATVAIFPQMAELPVDQVEEKFQHLRHGKTNEPYARYYYNKGL